MTLKQSRPQVHPSARTLTGKVGVSQLISPNQGADDWLPWVKCAHPRRRRTAVLARTLTVTIAFALGSVRGARVASVQAQSEADEEAARQAFRKGNKAFSEARYADALTEFTRGYDLSKRPRFLLNMAHTQRKLGQERDALASYRRFLLTDPRPQDRALAEDMVREIEAVLAQQDAAAASAQQATAAPLVRPAEPSAPVVMAPPPAPAPTPSLVHRWYFWGGLGALVVAGVVTGVIVANSKSSREEYRTQGTWGVWPL